MDNLKLFGVVFGTAMAIVALVVCVYCALFEAIKGFKGCDDE